MTRRLVSRLDNAGDVLLAGPAVRAVAASGDPVDLLVGPSGADAAALLPGVDRVHVVDAPWVPLEPAPATPGSLDAVLSTLRDIAAEEAIVLTSFHQSPLPLAVLLRQVGVRRVVATCVDYPGSLLDVRHPYLDDVHEVEQSLSLCAAAGHHLPDGDDGRLSIELPADLTPVDRPDDPYVVVHPGASTPARSLPLGATVQAVAELARRGWQVLLSGSPGERALVEDVARRAGVDATVVAGRTSLAELAHLVAGAAAVVCGNTGPAHLAAAVGTPVVEAFAPTVPPERWRPWKVPHVLLGVLDIACAGCRARTCPYRGQPCLAPFTAEAVADAIDALAVDAACREAVA